MGVTITDRGGGGTIGGSGGSSASGSGAQGSQGSQGAQGQSGSRGFQGFQGQEGLGYQGYQGAEGNTGNQGFQGQEGLGYQGYQGTGGDTGNQGLQGYQGFQGQKGEGGPTIAFKANPSSASSPNYAWKNSLVKAEFDNVVFDTTSGDYSSNTFTPSTAGKYHFHALIVGINVIWDGSTGIERRMTVKIVKNPDASGSGTVVAEKTFEGGANTSPMPVEVEGIADANGSDDDFSVWFQLDNETGNSGWIATNSVFEGYLINVGEKGNQGHQGQEGLGHQGHQGVKGDVGNQGFQGHQGYQGYQGHQGHQGYQGYQGHQGYQGLGYQGYQGIGSQGYQGFQGNKGDQGNQGFQGIDGSAVERGYQGFQGHQGLSGHVSGIEFIFDSNITENNQGAGRIWQNAFDVSSVSKIFIHDTDNAGNNIQSWKTFIGSANALGGDKGHLAIRKKDDETSFIIYNVTSSGVKDGNDPFDEFDVVFVEKSPSVGIHECPFLDGNKVVLQFFKTGERGEQGHQGSGSQGYQGLGTQGYQGHQGMSGEAAYQGSQGYQGHQGGGPQGYQGLGAQGHQGSQGYQGSGSQGYQGLGTQGNQGNNGCPSCFELVWNETIGDTAIATPSPNQIFANNTVVISCNETEPVQYQFMGNSGTTATVILNTTPFTISNQDGAFVWDWEGINTHSFSNTGESINQATNGCTFSITFNGGNLFFTLLKIT